MCSKMGDDVPVTQRYSALFLLDFSSRYAVERCGSNETIVTALMSIACVLPVWIWVSSIALAFTRLEFYICMAKYTLSLMTILQVGLLFIFEIEPPVLGCGPESSFPCPQVALSTYGLTTFICYDRDIHQQSVYMRFMMVFQCQIVCLSILWIGFGSPSAVLAGSMLGSAVGCVLHDTLMSLKTRPSTVQKIINFLEKNLGTKVVDTLITPIESVVDLEPDPKPNPKPNPIVHVNPRIKSLHMGYVAKDAPS